MGRARGSTLSERSASTRTRSQPVRRHAPPTRPQEDLHRLAAIVDASADAIVSATLDGILTSWNTAAEQLFGYSAEEAVGAPVSIILPPDRQDERRGFLEALQRGERVEHFESVRLTKSGARIPVSIGIAGIRNADGELTGVAASTRDISDRLQTQVEMKAGAERWQALSEATSEGIAIHDGERILEVNRAFCALFGVAAEDALGQDPWSFVAPEARADMRRRAKEDYSLPYESTGLRTDGSRLSIEISARSIDYQGRRLRVKLVRDLTAQKAAEAVLRHERELLQRILDTIPVMIAVYRPDTRVLQLNTAFERLTGWTSEAARGLDLMALCYPEPTYREEMRAYMALLEPGWRDVAMTTIDGRVLETSWANIRLSDDTYVGIGIDITERARADEHQQLLLDELNHRVKNILATVQSIARQTLSKDRPPAEAGDVFAERLRALSRSHDLLTATGFQGGSLLRLVEGGLQAFTQRVVVQGEDIMLRPRAVQTLGLVLHELATNASKYGALSVPDGGVEVRWSTMDDGRLRLSWRERGGPQVRPPLRSGFGRRMIEGAVAHDFAGEATLTFAPEGVSCEITIPLEGVAVA
jgi:PAS domain S-box-containing protein